MTSAFQVRAAKGDDAPSLEALGFDPAALESSRLIVIERDDVIIGAGDLVIGAAPAEPEAPSIRMRAAKSIRDAERAALLRGLIESARDAGHDRVLAMCDPMDFDELRLLESVGFAPTGRGPYFPIGGDQVQYITGYQDATGSTLDLAMNL